MEIEKSTKKPTRIREGKTERKKERKRRIDIIYSGGVLISGGRSESSQRRVEPTESKMAPRWLQGSHGADAEPRDSCNVAVPGGYSRERAWLKGIQGRPSIPKDPYRSFRY